LAPDKPTGTPILIGSAASAGAARNVVYAAAASNVENERVSVMDQYSWGLVKVLDVRLRDQYQPRFAPEPSISS
jgi:hypothetical protein